ncbi:MAG: F0F1 ATP synthase subunit gamma [Balneolaceae bacterium]
MSDTLINLQRRKQSAGDLGSVVRTMKAMATSNITQYEMAVESLQDYNRTISLGIFACLKRGNISVVANEAFRTEQISIALIFGSDQGLVGLFNDSITDFARDAVMDIPGEVEVWAVGERVYSILLDMGKTPKRIFNVPNSVTAITPLVNQILLRIEEYRQKNLLYRFYIFHNSPLINEGHAPAQQRLYPPDENWNTEVKRGKWPSQNLPQIIGEPDVTLRVLIREYLFVSIYKACAESLASENASRLEAMQRAEKNIDEMLEELQMDYNRLRQATIDSELFDVIAGFEALKDDN